MTPGRAAGGAAVALAIGLTALVLSAGETPLAIGVLVLLAVTAGVLWAGQLGPTSAPPGWLHPAALLGAGGAIALATSALPSADTFASHWHVAKFLTSADETLLIVLVAVAVLGALVGAGSSAAMPARLPVVSDEGVRRLRRAGTALACASLGGYAIWFVVAIGRGLTLGAIGDELNGVPGVASTINEVYFRTVPGVTTCTQFAGPAVAALFLARRLGARDRRSVALILALVVLSIVRTLLNSERLAVLEVVAPVALIAVVMTPRGLERRGLRRGMVATAPMLFPFLLVGLFGIFEYVRSWTYYSRVTDMTFTQFMLDRLAAYYATAANNSALILSGDHHAVLPYFSMRWLWEFPGLGKVVSYQQATGVDPASIFDTRLVAEGNPEFNNPGGWLPAAFDWGIAGGLVFWLVVGVAFGLIYRFFVRGNIVAWLLFATAFVGFFDTPRYFYWGEGRAVPALAGAVAAGWYVLRAAPRAGPALGLGRGGGVTALPDGPPSRW